MRNPRKGNERTNPEKGIRLYILFSIEYSFAAEYIQVYACRTRNRSAFIYISDCNCSQSDKVRARVLYMRAKTIRANYPARDAKNESDARFQRAH